MKTADAAKAIAAALPPDAFDDGTADALLDLVERELGHREALDRFAPYGAQFARAIGPATILHIVSGNTPHAALQSLARGLLLQARNSVKLPRGGLPEVAGFVAALPEPLRALVATATDLPDDWLSEAEVIVVFGSDETIEHFRRLAAPHQRFIAHGHRVSFCVVFADPGLESVAGAARDVSLHDQLGCLSPHVVYVAGGGARARRYAEALAAAMRGFNDVLPRRALSAGDAARIANLRAAYAFRAANDPGVAVWESRGGTDWTVIFERDPWFSASPLNRLVFVKPLPDDLGAAIAPVRRWLGAIGIWPPTAANAARVAALGASRICPIGRMQHPPATWHAEGRPNLGDLVRWVDFELPRG